MAKIYVNGDAQNVNLPLNVSELIKQLLVENPEMVSVKVDFLYFMGGGAL